MKKKEKIVKKGKWYSVFEFINDLFYIISPFLIWGLFKELMIKQELIAHQGDTSGMILWITVSILLWASCYGAMFYRIFFEDKIENKEDKK